MKIFKKYISPRIILNILLGITIPATVLLLFTVNRINSLLNADLGFNKDSVIAIRISESKIVLPDSLVFSSSLPGFHVKNSIDVKTENKKQFVKLAHQFVSDSYVEFFNYEKINEKPGLFLSQENAHFIYINESAVERLGIYDIDDAPGTRILTENGHELIVCGVLKDCRNLSIRPGNQAKIFQLSKEHLTYAFHSKVDGNMNEDEKQSEKTLLTLQERIHNRYKFIEDIIYSVFLFINVIILIIGIGYIGNKYAVKKERRLYRILGIGIHVLTLIISKAYIYILVFIGFVAGPLAFLIQKLWLEMYEHRIQFGLIDLFIILSVVILTLYLVCCSKTELNKRLKRGSAQINSI